MSLRSKADSNGLNPYLEALNEDVGQALLKVGGAEGRALVDGAIASNFTNIIVKAKLQALVDAATD